MSHNQAAEIALGIVSAIISGKTNHTLIPFDQLPKNINIASKTADKYLKSYGSIITFVKAHPGLFGIKDNCVYLKVNYFSPLVKMLSENLTKIGIIYSKDIELMTKSMSDVEKLQLESGIDVFFAKHYCSFKVLPNCEVTLRSEIDRKFIKHLVNKLLPNDLSLDDLIKKLSDEEIQWMGTTKHLIENYIKNNTNVFNYSNEIVSLNTNIRNISTCMIISEVSHKAANENSKLSDNIQGYGKITLIFENYAIIYWEKADVHILADKNKFTNKNTSLKSILKLDEVFDFTAKRVNNSSKVMFKAEYVWKVNNVKSQVIGQSGSMLPLSEKHGIIINKLGSVDVSVNVCYCDLLKIKNLFDFLKKNDQVCYDAKVIHVNGFSRLQAKLVWKGKKPKINATVFPHTSGNVYSKLVTEVKSSSNTNYQPVVLLSKTDVSDNNIYGQCGRISLTNENHGILKYKSCQIEFGVDVCYQHGKKINNLYNCFNENDSANFNAVVVPINNSFKWQATCVWKGCKPELKEINCNNLARETKPLSISDTKSLLKLSHSSSSLTSTSLPNLDKLTSDSNQSLENYRSEPPVESEHELKHEDYSPQHLDTSDDLNHLASKLNHDCFEFSNHFLSQLEGEEKSFLRSKTKDVACQTVSTGDILSFKLFLV